MNSILKLKHFVIIRGLYVLRKHGRLLAFCQPTVANQRPDSTLVQRQTDRQLIDGHQLNDSQSTTCLIADSIFNPTLLYRMYTMNAEIGYSKQHAL